MNATTLIQLSPEDLETLLASAVSKALEQQDRGDKWLDVPAAADHLSCTPEAIRQREKRGELPSHRLGKRILFSRVELDAYIRSGEAA
jgi:excisionase family DNA binding protein